MKVADLQRYLADLARLLGATDGKKAGADLVQIAEMLGPFGHHSLADFGDFLERAEGFHRTGVIPVIPPKGGRTIKNPPKPKVDLGALRDEVERSYNNASSPAVTLESIEGLRPKLAPLTKPNLLLIAEAIQLVGLKNKPKGDVLDEILRRIKSIKQSSIRTSIIDRPGLF